MPPRMGLYKDSHSHTSHRNYDFLMRIRLSTPMLKTASRRHVVLDSLEDIRFRLALAVIEFGITPVAVSGIVGHIPRLCPPRF